MKMSQFGAVSFSFNRPLLNNTIVQTPNVPSLNLQAGISQYAGSVEAPNTDPMKALVSKFGKASREWRTNTAPTKSPIDQAKPTDLSSEAVKAYNQRLEQSQSKPATAEVTSGPMTPQQVIAHNKNVQSLDQLIKPSDRSLESVRAYNERLEELKSKAKPESKTVQAPPPEVTKPMAPATSEAMSTTVSASSVRAHNETLESKPRERMSFQSSWKTKEAPDGWRRSTEHSSVGNSTPDLSPGLVGAKPPMTAQEIIEHNKNATRLADLIMPTDRSSESIRAYNERRAELSG